MSYSAITGQTVRLTCGFNERERMMTMMMMMMMMIHCLKPPAVQYHPVDLQLAWLT